MRCGPSGRRDLFGLVLGGESAFSVTLGQDLDRQVRAVALAQAAADAVGGFDDRIVGQDQTVLGTDLDADIAALAPLVDPTDIDEVDDGWRGVWSSFGGVGSSRSGISRGCSGTLTRTPVAEVYVIESPAASFGSLRPMLRERGTFFCRLLNANYRLCLGPEPLQLVVVALGRGEDVDDHRAEIQERPVGAGSALPADRSNPLVSELLADAVGNRAQLPLEPPEQTTK